MKKVFSFIILLCLPLMACSTDFKEGKEYTKVNDTKSAKAEVREYFSFYCPHCMKFEPFMAGVKKALPADVKFELNHVDFLRAASPKIQAMLSKAVVVGEKLNMSAKLNGAIFNYIQVQRAVITSEKDIRNIFVLNGADGEKFDKLMKSFGVNSQAKMMKKNQDFFANKGALTGVPTVIVNGKYRINNAELDKNDFAEQYNKLIKHLLTLN